MMLLFQHQSLLVVLMGTAMCLLGLSTVSMAEPLETSDYVPFRNAKFDPEASPWSPTIIAPKTLEFKQYPDAPSTYEYMTTTEPFPPLPAFAIYYYEIQIPKQSAEVNLKLGFADSNRFDGSYDKIPLFSFNAYYDRILMGSIASRSGICRFEPKFGSYTGEQKATIGVGLMWPSSRTDKSPLAFVTVNGKLMGGQQTHIQLPNKAVEGIWPYIVLDSGRVDVNFGNRRKPFNYAILDHEYPSTSDAIRVVKNC